MTMIDNDYMHVIPNYIHVNMYYIVFWYCTNNLNKDLLGYILLLPLYIIQRSRGYRTEIKIPLRINHSTVATDFGHINMSKWLPNEVLDQNK